MIVADVMTKEILSVTPDTTIEDAANLMLQRGVSGVLVVDGRGDLAGVVTEGDLLRRKELGTEPQRPSWLQALISPGREAADFTRAHGRLVRDVMTDTVVSVPHDATLETIVELMEKHHIKRVPVTADGGVVGVVSRSDLLRVLVGRGQRDADVPTDDETLRGAIREAFEQQSWAPTTTLNVTVDQGMVNLGGTITNEDERRAICVLVENVPGVKTVKDHLVLVEPYSGTVIEAPDDRA